MKNQHIKISGMTCASCANHIEKSLNKLEGVSKVNVNFATESCDISFDQNKIDSENIFKAIEGTGYTPIDEDYKEMEFKIMAT